MGAFGDERKFWVWAGYHRWPLFAIFAIPFGITFGFLAQGLVGAVGGLIVAPFFGLMAGMALGRDAKMFPVIIDRWVKYGGDAPKTGQRFPGRVQTRAFPQAGAPSVEDIRIEYLDGMTIRRMPNFGPPVWTNDSGKPVLMVMQIDRFLYLPMSWRGGVLTAHRMPVYYSEQVKNEKGEIVTEVPKFKVQVVRNADKSEKLEFVKDELGKHVRDESGYPLQVSEQDEVVFDSNQMQDLDGKVVEIPKGLAAKLNNDRAEFTQAYSLEASLYKTGGFWEKYGMIITSGFFIMAIVIVTTLALIRFSDINHEYVVDVRSSLDSASANNLETAKLNAQVASALLKAGFNYSTTFIIANGSIQSTNPQQVTPIRIPFIG